MRSARKHHRRKASACEVILPRQKRDGGIDSVGQRIGKVIGHGSSHKRNLTRRKALVQFYNASNDLSMVRTARHLPVSSLCAKPR